MTDLCPACGINNDSPFPCRNHENLNPASDTFDPVERQRVIDEKSKARADAFAEAEHTRWLMQQPMTGWPK